MGKAMRALVAAGLATLLAGCAFWGGGAGAPSQPPTPSVPKVPTALNGQYTLTRVSGQPLPSLRSTQNGCRVQLDGGELDIYGARFDLNATTRRLCGDMVVARTLHHVSGSYHRNGRRLKLTVDRGHYFRHATATLVGQAVRVLTLDHADGSSEPVDWHFERKSKQPKPSGLGS